MYQSVFTTGTQSGEATITVSVDDMSKTVTAELRATMMDVANSTLSANEPSGDVVADGQQAYTLTLTAVDSEGNPVTGEASRLRLVPQDTNGVTVGAISEIKPGFTAPRFLRPVPETLLCVPSASSISWAHYNKR